MYMGKHRALWRAMLAAALLLLLALLAWTLYLRWEQPPDWTEEIEPAQETNNKVVQRTREEYAAAGNIHAGRKRGVYTLLLAGRDDSSGCTDTVLLGCLDTQRHRLDLVSVPRDTLVNLDWKVRKLNAVYAGTANSGGTAIEGLQEEMRKLCGFTPDCYAVVDLDVFVDAVDLIGGVDYELPQDMHYDDEAQDLHIHLDAGLRHLTGEEAMGLVRYRSGYLNGDLDRVAVQQGFMEAVLGELLSFGSVPHLPELAALLASHTDTNLSAANIAWLARQALGSRREDLHFYTMPNTPVTVAGLSYTLAEPEAWLAMINACLNPYTVPIRLENLDLVYRDAEGFHATSGWLRGASYYSDEEMGTQ